MKEDTTKKRAKKASPSIGCRRWTLQLNSFILAILCWISRKLKFNEHSLLYFCKEFNESGVDVFVTGHWMSSGWTQCEMYETSSRDKNLNDTIHMLLRRLFILHDSIMISSWFFYYYLHWLFFIKVSFTHILNGSRRWTTYVIILTFFFIEFSLTLNLNW